MKSAGVLSDDTNGTSGGINMLEDEISQLNVGKDKSVDKSIRGLNHTNPHD